MIARRKPLPRSQKPLKRTPVKRVNAKRRKKNHARAYGGAGRIAFVKSLPCVVKGRPDGFPVRHDGPIEVMHTKSGGTARKADARLTVPCCQYHHRNAHTWGIETWQRAYGVDLEHEAANVAGHWDAMVAEGCV